MRARGWASLWVGVFLGLGATAALADECCDECSKEKLAAGRELFVREWTVGDTRSHGGDGLGPVYNDTSCVACHNAGAPGGAGPGSKNVDILTAAVNQFPQGMVVSRPPGFFARALEALTGIEVPKPPPPPAKPQKPDTKELIKAHAGFKSARSVVLHRFGNDPGYEAWRWSMLGIGQFAGQMPGSVIGPPRADVELQQVKSMIQFEGGQFGTQSQFGPFSVTRSQRNPTALFGSGLIDSIPNKVLEQAAKAKYEGFPEIQGRVSRQKDGRIGRFGWKAQTPSLSDFVLTACAVELGLEVADHHQGGLPQSPSDKAKGLDLNKEECDALISYIRTLPKPDERKPMGESETKEVAAGKASFASVGCATCHTPKLGEVAGIYSDLLLHDLGADLGDVGQYGVFTPESSEPEFVDTPDPIAENATPTAPAGVTVEVPVQQPAAGEPTQEIAVPVAPPGVAFVMAAQGGGMGMMGQGVAGPTVKRPTSGPANRFEWRTPPLWGVRDSGPYLHDGRAETIDQAIALHGGEATNVARKYFELKPRERLQLQAFLKSLTAPTEALARAGD